VAQYRSVENTGRNINQTHYFERDRSG